MIAARRSIDFCEIRWPIALLALVSAAFPSADALAQNARSTINDANRQNCLTGQYPSLCDLNRLNAADRKLAEAARKKVNLDTCLTGQYPILCDYKLLNAQERLAVLDARKKANLRICLEGQYAELCDKTLLSRDELVQAENSEEKYKNRLDNFKRRLDRIRQTDPDIYTLVIGRLNNASIAGGFTLDTQDAVLDCQEMTHGFESCTVKIGVDVKSHAEHPDTRKANITVSCESDIVVRSQQGQTTRESGDGSESLYIRAGGSDSATVEIDLNLHPRYDDPFVKANISSASCKVSSID